MTTLSKRVNRETSVSGEPRPIIVSIVPGSIPTLEFREKGRKVSYPLPVKAAYLYAAKLYAEAHKLIRKRRTL